MRRRAGLLAAVLVALLSAALVTLRAPGGGLHRLAFTSAGGVSTQVLTPDGTDYYDVTLLDGAFVVSAPATNTGGNLREVFWPSAERPVTDSRVCATWLDASVPNLQQGVALRIAVGTRSTRALTVTKNVYGGAFWVFDVHTWDSGSAHPFTPIGQYDLSGVVSPGGVLQPLPWRICAEVAGRTLRFKVWLPGREAEPGWSDPVRSRTMTVPEQDVRAGTTGWYVGHVPAAGVARYGGLGIWQ